MHQLALLLLIRCGKFSRKSKNRVDERICHLKALQSTCETVNNKIIKQENHVSSVKPQINSDMDQYLLFINTDFC